ncbi:hypothetical protein EV360DRAFT_42723 [Lentinula raphanica]|nr:hypothetical protein EV360DRAFT_42723 [Lentinula raphanica]
MHPIFATSSADAPAPIRYDVTRPPSRTSVRCNFDESSPKPNGEAVPAHVLAEPATDPPTSGRLVLRCDRFAWEVVVFAGCSAEPATTTTSNTRRGAAAAIITNSDVLHAVYHTLRTPVRRREWDSLESDKSMQRRVGKAYARRAQEGVRRVDWLMGRTRLVGVVVERNAGNGESVDGVEGVGKLVFIKAKE